MRRSPSGIGDDRHHRIALAEALDAVLITCDGRLAAVPGARAAVEVIAS